MGTNFLTFDERQFSNVFPFYILVNNNSVVQSIGKSLRKLNNDDVGRAFSEGYKISRPETAKQDFESLKNLCGQLVTIAILNQNKNLLRGQFEYIENVDQLLFVGSPWFNSIEQVTDCKLTLNDFSHHDPLIDLLHLLKNQEIVNEDLKDLLTTVNHQKNELRKKEDDLIRLSQLASVNANGVLFTDDSGKIIWVNEGFCKMMGYAEAEVIGKTTIDFCRGPLSDDAQLEKISQEIGQTESFNSELIHYRKDSSFFWARVKGQSFKIGQKQELQYFAVVEDITAEKAKEEQLQVLSKIAEDNINAVVITDNHGRISWVNKSFTRMTGYTLEEAIYKKPGHLLQGPKTDPYTIAYLKRQISSGEPFNAEVLNYAKSGKTYWLRIQGQPIRNSNKELIGFFATEEDISSEREIKNLLERSESQFRLALEKIGDNIWEHNFKTGETFFSKKNNELWGYYIDQSTNIESLWWDNVFPEDLHFLKENYLKYQKGKIDSHSLEYRIVQRDGSIKWILDRGGLIEKDEDGKPLRIVGTHTDITRIKQTETELEQRVKQFRSLSENIPGIIYEYEFKADGTEGIRYISPAIERVFGIKPGQFKNYLTFVHPEDRDRIILKNQHSRDTLEPFYDESRLLVPGQSPKWQAVHSSFSYLSQSGSKVFTGFMMDITERKNIEQTLLANEEKYRNIIENMNLGLLEVDNDENITYANQRFCSMSGYAMTELLGQTARKFLAVENGAALLEDKLKVRKNGVADAYELSITDKSGDKKWWFVSGAPRYNDRGELVGSIGIHLDITEQKKLEAELIEARERAEHLARTKETFLANMSHEIRTPMNAIMGMTRQLSKTELSETQKFYLNVIHSASDNLLVIINDILDLSKVEAGKLSLENIGFSARDVIGRAIQVLAHKAEEKGLKLSNSIFDEEIAPILIGDPYRLNQILLNLMGNAIKFTEKGFVDVVFNLINNSDTTQTITIAVKDSGIGMEQSYLKRLFDEFSQANESVSRKYGGTGLGMSISRNLVELMGGKISAESEKGVGTTITLKIEFKKGKEEDLPLQNQMQFGADFLAGKKIMVTDDNEMNRLVASIILKNHGAEVVEAVNGMQTLEIIKHELVDLILMDMQMPVMNGTEATKLLRERGFEIPIVALTAEAIKGEREKCLALGMNDYITKPIKEEEFLEVIGKLLNQTLTYKPVNTIKMEEESLFDLSELEQLSRGNTAFVIKMAGMFCELTPPMVTEMIAAYHDRDLEKMGALAHKIKPSLDNLRVISLKQPIRDIELAGRENNFDPELPALLEKTEAVISKVIGQMKERYLK